MMPGTARTHRSRLLTDLCLTVDLLAELLVDFQLLSVYWVVPLVHFCQLGEQGVGSLELCQGMLKLCQLVGVPSRPACLESQLSIFLHITTTPRSA